MEKIIWVVGNNRTEMIEAQKRINSTGSMRAFSILSFDALQKAVKELEPEALEKRKAPSLIILDYETEVAVEFIALSLIKSRSNLAGVPLFFMVNTKSEELDDECYLRGATVVLHKPFTDMGVVRIERTAWQHEVTKNYEKMIQKQASDLLAAKEIMHLNQQLKSRNKLLYQIFGRYFSDNVVDSILEKPEGAVIGGEKRELTVLMADLRGFTSLSEELEPDIMTNLLNSYFEKMLDIITLYHGVVIEFLGDAILVVFGGPIVQENQTADAIAAAIQMQNRMEEVNRQGIAQGYPALEMGIGIHRGEVFIGNIGSDKMMRYNVIGRAVNECSRIESYSVGGQILASEETIAKAECVVHISEKQEIMVKGFHEPIQVCDVIGVEGLHQCVLEKREEDILYYVEKEIEFRIYPIVGKMREENYIGTILVQISDRKAKVVREMENSVLPELYTDVEIQAVRKKDGQLIFSDVYAKVIEWQKENILLHITHSNQAYKEMVYDLTQITHKYNYEINVKEEGVEKNGDE